MELFRQVLSVNSFKDDIDATQRALMLNAASLTLFVSPLILIVFNFAFGNEAERSVNMALALVMFSQIPVQFLMRTRRLRSASILFLLTGWIMMTWVASKVEGVGDVALVSYILILLGAGYLLGWRSVTLITTWSILSVWCLAIFESLGILRPAESNPIRVALDLTLLFVIASLEIYFVMNTLMKSLQSAKKELSERQRVEWALRSEQEKLSLALHASKMETWEWDIETGAISWSNGIEAMFGLGSGQFDGKYETYMALIHPDDINGLQAAIGRSLEDENFDYVVEHRLVRPDGEIRWLEGRGKVYRDESGKPVRMAGTVVDITSRKDGESEREKLIRELAAKNTELEQFTYTVSHDLKAPIITIKGFLGFLSEDVRTRNVERIDKDIVRITDAVDRMNTLLSELLELSRIGRMMNPPEEIAFGDLVDEAMELVQGRMQNPSVKIVTSDKFPVVMGDRRRLLEVVQNLLDNALKFSAHVPEPRIEIGWDGYDNEKPIFYIRDNGIGISPDHHDRIFDLFNKLNPAMDGTGVGLALVKRIVEFHGGKIWVESEENRGASFQFTLPASG